MGLEKFIGLPGGANEISYSKDGYKHNSPDKHNPYNIINSSNITMNGVPHPVYGVDDLGNGQVMMPGNNYQFPGSRVLEVPMQAGGEAFTPHMMYNPNSPEEGFMANTLEEHLRMQDQGFIHEDELQQAKSGIHIKKENRGKFTAKAKAAGAGVQEFARRVLAAPEGKYSASTRKQANFARNAAKWKKQDGGMTGMMKAKIAMEDQFGSNPAIQRMIAPTDQPYDFGDGWTGTHHMGSYGDYAIPNIQDVNGALEYTGPRMNEAIQFNNPGEADYFAEHYKTVAPALRQSGGQTIYVDDPNDPRIAAYQDSLQSYLNKARGNKWLAQQWPKFHTDEELTELMKIADRKFPTNPDIRLPQEQVEATRRKVATTTIEDSGILPDWITPGSSKADLYTFKPFKKPEQPYAYREPTGPNLYEFKDRVYMDDEGVIHFEPLSRIPPAELPKPRSEASLAREAERDTLKQQMKDAGFDYRAQGYSPRDVMKPGSDAAKAWEDFKASQSAQEAQPEVETVVKEQVQSTDATPKKLKSQPMQPGLRSPEAGAHRLTPSGEKIPVGPSIEEYKQNRQDGGYIDVELTDTEISNLRAMGYRIEDL